MRYMRGTLSTALAAELDAGLATAGGSVSTRKRKPGSTRSRRMTNSIPESKLPASLRPSAKKARAYQTNRNLVLTEGAGAESIPNLQIEANDVVCSHASAVGPIDDDQLYYLESRGVRPDEAERLIVLGFFDDVFDRLPVPSLVRALRRTVVEKIEHRRG